jgi:hypothetical protein
MLAHVSHRAVDAHRHALDGSEELVGRVPEGDVLRWFSLGFETQLSDWIWIQAVLRFGEDSGIEPSPEQTAWFKSALRASIDLDPEWRTLYSYGSLMMKVLEDYSASSQILELAVEQFPEDEYFPFSLGANHYLQASEAGSPRLSLAFWASLSPGRLGVSPALRKSLQQRHSVLLAHMWMLYASQKEKAPDWYASAAHAFIVQKNEREVGIRFLADQLEGETDPVLVERLTVQLNSQLHDLHSERLSELAAQFLARTGRPLESVEELVKSGLLQRVPNDPYEADWVVDVDGVVRSLSVVEMLETRARNSERNMLAFGL